MDSIRKSGYKGGIKPIAERKRRKSDLVIMWQSIWDVTFTISLELRLILLGLWETLKFYFNSNDQQEVRKWLVEYLPRVPDDFAESWRDGILLSILLNKLIPGCYPGANDLDANYALRNLYHVFQILEYHFNITPKCTVEEIITCSNGSDSKLLELLLQLKNETDTKVDEIKPALLGKESEEDIPHNSATSTNSVAKGTGLMVGFVGRAANFIVFFASMSDLDLVVEIKGPRDTICTERITKRSPKKKQVLKPWKPASPHNVARCSSKEDRNSYNIKKNPITEIEDETRYMPLEYEIHSNRVYFAYMPLVKGDHQIKILSQGMHVSDSPYTVAVGPVVGPHKNTEIGILKPSSRVENYSDHAEPKKAFVRFQEPCERKERLGKIIKRRVLRYIVKIDNKNIVVDTDSINNLATSLLKMDYEFQKPSLSRRNSWGFVGDAERKVSVIRQFCVNIDELEAQSVKLHRSQSISGSCKRAFSRSGSYECEDIQKLETVTEGTVSHFDKTSYRNTEAEETLVDLNEDFENNTEYSKNNPECFVTVDKQISDSKYPQDLIEDLIEVSSIENDFTDNQNLHSRRNAEATLNSLRVETEIFNQINNTEPLDLLSSASVTPRRHVEQINNNTRFTNNVKSCSKINSSDLNEMENQDCTIREIKTNCDKIGCGPLKECISFAENNDSNNNVSGINYEKGMSEQKYIKNTKENEISDEVFIEEELCTKTEIRTANQTFQNSKKISGYCSGSKSNSRILKEDLNPVECLENVSIRKILKDPRRSKQPRRCHYKKMFTNPKMLKKIKEYQRYSKQKAYRPLFELSSGYFQNINNAPNTEKCNNKIRSKLSKDNVKIGNVSLSSNQNNTQMKNSYKASFVNSSEDSNFSYNQKKFNRNHSKFLVNNLKSADYKPNRLYAKINACNDDKIASEFTKVVKLPYYGKINSNNKLSLNNPQLDESNNQISSLSQINGDNSDDLPRSFSNKTSSSSVAFSQLNFRHFNPTLPNKRISLVRNRINQWERAVFEEDLTPRSKNSNQLVSKAVDITSRLNFWKAVTKEKELQQEFYKMTSGNSKGIEENIADRSQPISTVLEMKDNNSSQPTFELAAANSRKTVFHLNEEFSVSQKKLDDKLSSSLTFQRTRRSASDPEILEVCIQDSHFTLQGESSPGASHQTLNQEKASQSTDPHTSSRESMSLMAQQTSSAEYPSSSSLFFDNSMDDEDEESSADLLDSTEDEYIDDEISERTSAYWGDLRVMEHLKDADANEYRDLCRIVDGDFWKYERDFRPPCAIECQVFGITMYFGYVAVKNRFQVLTKGAGCGNLSATVQGFGHHDVSQVTVRYVQKDVYEVTYQVMSPGVYLISVRWMESPIVGSPFLCKVTF